MMKNPQSTRTALAIAILSVILLAVGFVVLTRKPQTQEEQIDWRDLVRDEEKVDKADTSQKNEEDTYKMPTVIAPTKKEIEATKAAGKVTALIETDKGDIEVVLRGDLMPLTVCNFVKLAKAGFYDGLNFHRVEDWVIQGGDPSGDGTGGPGYTIKLEISKELSNTKGAVAMARAQDPNSAGSQFYILKQKADWLDGQYAVFGNVTKGMPVVEQMAIGDKIKKVTVK